jgi:myosin V
LFTSTATIEVSPVKSNKGSPLNSVCFQFKEQLTNLVHKIEVTAPHYVRCVKPNDLNKPNILHTNRLVEQLRCGGVLEAVKVARSGFPYRMDHAEFYERYRAQANVFSPQYSKLPLHLSDHDKTVQVCQALVPCLWDDTSGPKPTSTASRASRMEARKLKFMLKWKGKTSSAGVSRESIQVGKDKVFFRKPPHDLLEGRRSRLIYLSASKLQGIVRGFMVRVVLVKRVTRKEKAAIIIQKYYRAYYYSSRLNTVRLGVIFFQAAYRGKQARKNIRKILENDERYISKHRPQEQKSAVVKKAIKKVKPVHNDEQKTAKEEKLNAIVDAKERKAGKLSTLFGRLPEEKAKTYKSRIPRLWSHERLLKLFGLNPSVSASPSPAK